MASCYLQPIRERHNRTGRREKGEVKVFIPLPLAARLCWWFSASNGHSAYQLVFPFGPLWSPVSGLPLSFQAKRRWQPPGTHLSRTAAQSFSVFLKTLPGLLQTAPLENSQLFCLSESSVSCLDFIWYTRVLRNCISAVYSNKMVEDASNTTNAKGKWPSFVGGEWTLSGQYDEVSYTWTGINHPPILIMQRLLSSTEQGIAQKTSKMQFLSLGVYSLVGRLG